MAKHLFGVYAGDEQWRQQPRGSQNLESFAYRSMSAPLDAKEVPHVPTATPVPSVETSPMAQPGAASDAIFPIVTKLKAEAWELAEC